MKQLDRALNAAFILLFLLAIPIQAMAQKDAKQREKEKASQLPAAIWRDPGDISTFDLIYGAGGREHAPDPNGTYTFEKEVMHGTSPKFDVKDAQGVKWRVKMGEEVQAETAATRLLWAVGYFVDEDYYLPEIKVSGLPKLHRGEKFVSGGEIVHRVRLKLRRRDVKKLARWSWFDNPFRDTRELNGLRVMMALINNWDLDSDNNSIYEV